MRLYIRWLNLSQNRLLDVTNLKLFFLCNNSISSFIFKKILSNHSSKTKFLRGSYRVTPYFQALFLKIDLEKTTNDFLTFQII